MRRHDREQHEREPPAIDAVLLDVDGVVTDTAQAHAAAWKRLFDAYLRQRAEARGDTFEPFDDDRDYREYVDGKPRYDGVRSFLESRGIDLPQGSEDDGSDEETVCGLGNRKNHYFHTWLQERRVRTYPGTLAFIAALKAAGIKAAAFSSSRNAAAVLRNAGVLDLFDAKVDGADMAALQLPGKPDPAILHEAAARLGVAPGRAAVVEDAIAGVEAGARGDFALVIGVDRTGQEKQLARAGADLVVGDLAELAMLDGEIVVKTLDRLPSVWDSEPMIRERIGGKRLAVFLDYDGTLTPIVEDPAKADLGEDMRKAVAALASKITVGIVSGRDLEDLRSRVGLDSVFLAGSHGFDIAGPKGWHETLQKGMEFLPDLDSAASALREQVEAIEGAAVERKKFSIAVHYRRVLQEDTGRLEEAVDRVLDEHRRLHKGHGKKVFRLQPATDWDKGHAVDWLLERLELDRQGVLPIYVGDDVTDEGAFRSLAGRGITVAVRDGERRTAADLALADPDDVRRFLEWLRAVVSGNATHDR
jgi:trehalose 6-phosphate phosphatase